MLYAKSTLSVTGSMIAALALASHAAFASAEPPGPPGPGMGGPGVIRLLDELHTTLALTNAQEALWQQLKTDETTMQTRLQVLRQDTGSLVDVELAKTTPDLVAIMGIFEDSRNAARALLEAFEQESLAFYAKLTAAQQAIVVAAFRQHLQHAASGRPGPR